MSFLEYVSTNTIFEHEVYSMIHQCTRCPYISKSWFCVTNHVKRHLCKEFSVLFDCSRSNLETLVCKDCSFITSQTVTFKNHIVNHNRENIEVGVRTESKDTLDPNNEASACEDFRSRLFVQDTESTSKSEDPREGHKWFQCDKCSYKNKQQVNLEQHTIKKHKSKDDAWLHCDRCSFKTKFKRSLQTHKIRKHTSPKDIEWFHCDHCSVKSKSKSDLRKHMICYHTPNEDIEWAYCNHCSFRCKMKSNLRKHIIRKHKLTEDIK